MNVDMPLSLGLGALIVLGLNLLMAVYMVREPGKQALTYFIGMFSGGLIIFMAACDVPAFTGPNGLQFVAKPKVPVIGDFLSLIFSVFSNPPIDPQLVDPALVGTIFRVAVIVAIYLGVAKLAHLKPFDRPGAASNAFRGSRPPAPRGT